MANKKATEKKEEILSASQKKQLTPEEVKTDKEQLREMGEPTMKDGVAVSNSGVAIFPKGEHPRDLRKKAAEKKEVPEYFRAGFDGWLEEQSEEVQELAKEDEGRVMGMYQSSISSMNLAQFGIVSAGRRFDDLAFQEPYPAMPGKKTLAIAKAAGVKDTKSK